MMKKLLYLLLIVPFISNAQFWTDKATSFATAARGVNSISIVDANTVWVKAFDGSGGASNTVQEYAKSTDGGNTWTSGVMNLGLGGSPTLGVGNISAVSGTTAWAALFPNANALGGIWKTTNGGTSWTKQTSALYNTTGESFTNWVHFFDANNGVSQGDPAGGYFEIYTTSNGGTTWTRVPSANIPVNAPVGGEYGLTNLFEAAGGTIWFGTDTGRLYKSTNMGLNWTVATTPSSVNDYAFSFKDTNNGLLLKDDGNLYKSTDGGATWVAQAYTGPIFTGDMTYVPGTSSVVAVGFDNANASANGTAYSLDDGATWTAGDAVGHLQVEFFNTTTGFTGGFNTSATVGGIAKYTGTALPVKSFEAIGFSVYPNPVNDSFTIQNANNIAISGLTISDINGRTVKTLNVNAIENQINISDLNSGIYFLNITSDQGSAAKKIIKN